MKRYVGEAELYELERYCSNIARVDLEPVPRLIKEVRERRENEDKYRWHDLRNNPDDLPEKDGEYLVYVFMRGNIAFGLTARKFYMIGQWEGEFYNIKKPNEVLAWREIEHFEDVE